MPLFRRRVRTVESQMSRNTVEGEMQVRDMALIHSHGLICSRSMDLCSTLKRRNALRLTWLLLSPYANTLPEITDDKAASDAKVTGGGY